MVYTFDMIDATGRVDHVQLHLCETAADAVFLAKRELLLSSKAVGIEIWQGTMRVARVSPQSASTSAMA
jgi:hypothetical protein